jgi:O-antigen/teichoic acid export membrane protein
VFSVAMLFGAFDAIELWLQSELRARTASIAKSAGVLLAAAISAMLVVVGAPLVALVVAAALEYVFVGVALGVAYLALGQSPARWRSNRNTMGRLLGRSWPLFISGGFAAINLRVDQVMLQAFYGPDAVGTYAAAARLSELWYFLPTALTTSLFPALILARQRSAAEYRDGLQAAYDLVLWVAIPVAAVVSWQSQTIINLLFGPGFGDAASILSIHVWAGPFMFVGAVLSKWLIAEDLLRFSMYRHGAAAVINILLNLLLIPMLGGIGAAISTLLSYGVAAVGMCVLYPPTRPAAAQMFWALTAPIRFLGHKANATGDRHP